MQDAGEVSKRDEQRRRGEAEMRDVPGLSFTPGWGSSLPSASADLKLTAGTA